MKITSRLFIEDFITVAGNLQGRSNNGEFLSKQGETEEQRLDRL
jgi:hypothetical protein